MFEITGDDITALNDEDLRSLVGLLCEAELRRAALSPSAVTWGGNQTAKDGGLDVRVALPQGTKIEGFLPRAATGFQVKTPDMPRSEILKEIRFKGTVRPTIASLAADSGAYIIVSSTGSTADSALKSRCKAMVEAVSDCPDAAKLYLDFYDRNRVASWVRDHAGLIPWVRSRIGKSLRGWQSFGNWSHVPAGADTKFLLDEQARIKTGRKEDGNGLAAVDGINRLRDTLRSPGQVVRLVGLSGVGKTRLVEALFEGAIGVNALDPSLAIYTDTGDEPDPQPKGLASDLITSGTRAILVIDNCPPATHKQLADMVRAAGATISVITIEYDIREDQPEGTDIFSLETSSLPLIEKLVRSRYPALSQVDARTIAEFSGGNARIALALSATVEKSETVAGLTDTELFTRLFRQRHEHDANLLQIAEVCSLVYSFEGETLTGDHAELPILGGLIGKTAQDVFRAAKEMKRRDLLQQRREWRAVLPHAIANRLAALALQNIPYSVIDSAIVRGSSERLLRSFSRRLGYLDASVEAQAIVRSWLAAGGLLASLLDLSELGHVMFENVAPVLPEATLAALENVFSSADKETLLAGGRFIRLIHALAFDAALFERAVTLLSKFASVLDEGDLDGAAVKAATPLFFIAFSGTRAPLPMRLAILRRWLTSDGHVEQHLGIKALESVMTSDHFMPYSNFEFGARSRDFGYWPETGLEVGAWFDDVLTFAEPFALGETAVAARVSKAIARKFRGLWTYGGRYDGLERVAKAIAGDGFWREGWIAARQTQQYDSKAMDSVALERLAQLEKFLRPKDLLNRVRGLVLGERGGSLDFEDFDLDDDVNAIEQRMKRAALAVEELGKDAVADEEAFDTLLPELIRASGRLGEFGRGLALGAETPRTIWDKLVGEVARHERPNVQILLGFLSGLEKTDIDETNKLLNEAIDDPVLAKWLPTLQTSVVIDDTGVGRLHRALKLGKAEVGRFIDLMYGGVCEPISGPAFRDLMLAIGRKPDGNCVALEILSMRLHSDGTAKRKPLPETVETGRRLLADYKFVRNENAADHDDYKLGVIAAACLVGPEGKPVARDLVKSLKRATGKYSLYASEHDDLLRALFKAQPLATLDELSAGRTKDRQQSVELVQGAGRYRRNPSESLQDEKLLSWCDLAPEMRYPFAAGIALLFTRPNDQTPHEWRPIATALLERAPDPVAVFEAVMKRLWPMSFSGSVASEFDSRVHLLDKLAFGTNDALVNAVKAARAKLTDRVEKERRREREEDLARSARFE